MFIIYIGLFALFCRFGPSYIKKENITIIYLIFVMLSPALIFLENNVNYGLLEPFLNTEKYTQIFVITYLLFTGIYWIAKLVKEEKSDLSILRNEGIALALILLGPAYVKILVLLFICGILGISLNDKVEFKIKYIMLILVLLAVLIRDALPIYLILSLYIVLLIKYFLEQTDKIDHYVLLVLTTILVSFKLLDQQWAIIIMLTLFISFLRFKIVVNDRSKILNKMGHIKIISENYFALIQNAKKDIKLNFIEQEEIQKTKVKIASNIEMHPSEQAISELLIVTIILIVLLFTVGTIWF